MLPKETNSNISLGTGICLEVDWMSYQFSRIMIITEFGLSRKMELSQTFKWWQWAPIKKQKSWSLTLKSMWWGMDSPQTLSGTAKLGSLPSAITMVFGQACSMLDNSWSMPQWKEIKQLMLTLRNQETEPLSPWRQYWWTPMFLDAMEQSMPKSEDLTAAETKYTSLSSIWRRIKCLKSIIIQDHQQMALASLAKMQVQPLTEPIKEAPKSIPTNPSILMIGPLPNSQQQPKEH